MFILVEKSQSYTEAEGENLQWEIFMHMVLVMVSFLSELGKIYVRIYCESDSIATSIFWKRHVVYELESM